VARAELAGQRGPTIAPVYSKPDGAPGQAWFAVTLVLAEASVLPAVEHLRALGSTGITVTPIQYAFSDQSEAYARLEAQL
jgi:ATP phosphoribosyltransferase